LIDTSAHQKKVVEFEREVVNSIADAFSGVATESFVVRYGNEVETLQDWSPLDAGLKKISTRIELDAESFHRFFEIRDMQVGFEESTEQSRR